MSQNVRFRLADDTGTGGLPQTDPNASLKGKMSTTEIQDVESTLTAVSTTPKHIFTDETQVTGYGFPPPAGAGDSGSSIGGGSRLILLTIRVGVIAVLTMAQTPLT
jgi:hypothetical protein